MSRSLAAPLVVAVVAVVTACAAKEPAAQRQVAQVRFEPPAGSAADGAEAEPPRPQGPRKLIRTVNLQLRVADTEATAEAVRELTEAAGGYVASVDAHRREGLLYYRIGLRIPVERLDAAVEEIKALAVEVERESLGTEDVTGRYVDLEARLRTLRATETELQALLAESRSRGHKAEDIMAIYRELTGIRTQIEQHQAQLDLLADQTSYSTVHLDLRPTEAARPLIDEGWQPLVVARDSFRTLLEVLQGLGNLAIFLLVVGVPVVLILGLPVWLAFRAWRRRRVAKP